MDPNQPTPTNPMPPSELVDPAQTGDTIQYTTPIPAEQPAPEPTSPTQSVDLATSQPAPALTTEPFNPPVADNSGSMNAVTPTSGSTGSTSAPIPPVPIATQPVPIGGSLLPKLPKLPKIPLKFAIIGLIVLVILIVVLSLTLSNPSKPSTVTNSGATSQPKP